MHAKASLTVSNNSATVSYCTTYCNEYFKYLLNFVSARDD